jgi:hypothetical protein
MAAGLLKQPAALHSPENGHGSGMIAGHIARMLSRNVAVDKKARL